MRYVVPNFDRRGEVIEVFPVETFFDTDGNRTDDPDHAASFVIFDGTCRHRLDVNSVNIYPVH